MNSNDNSQEYESEPRKEPHSSLAHFPQCGVALEMAGSWQVHQGDS